VAVAAAYVRFLVVLAVLVAAVLVASFQQKHLYKQE
jgi:hypothetical protein